MPKGATINGFTFLFTGTLTEFTRAVAETLVKDNGGTVVSGVTSKLNYLVVGSDAGSKLDKAKALGTVKILTEKEFLKMVPKGKTSAKKADTKKAAAKKEPAKKEPTVKPVVTDSKKKGLKREGVKQEDNHDVVVIGNQTWMAKNLDVYSFRDGTPISVASTPEEFESLGENGIPACMVYGNKKKNYAAFGLLYNWYAVKSERGLAPEGFEVPSTLDWDVLQSQYGYGKDANAAITADENGQSRSGFNALRGGATFYGQLDALNISCAFWTRDAWDNDKAFYQTFGDHSAGLTDRNARDYASGFSVRCILGSCSKSHK